jgi:hypothetical protein
MDKAEDVCKALRRQCTKGTDVYFDNVGGDILDAALANLARHARIVICGAISQYNNTTPVKGPSNYLSLLGVIAESSRKSTLRSVDGRADFSLPKHCVFSFRGLGGRLAEQVARDVNQREPPPFFRQFVCVGLDEDFDGFVAGMNFDSQRRALEINLVTPSRFTANNCVGHLRCLSRVEGIRRHQDKPSPGSEVV